MRHTLQKKRLVYNASKGLDKKLDNKKRSWSIVLKSEKNIICMFLNSSNHKKAQLEISCIILISLNWRNTEKRSLITRAWTEIRSKKQKNIVQIDVSDSIRYFDKEALETCSCSPFFYFSFFFKIATSIWFLTDVRRPKNMIRSKKKRAQQIKQNILDPMNHEHRNIATLSLSFIDIITPLLAILAFVSWKTKKIDQKYGKCEKNELQINIYKYTGHDSSMEKLKLKRNLFNSIIYAGQDFYG